MARAHIVSKLSDPVTLIGVAFGYNELWCPPYMNSLFVIPKKMWPLATTNCNGLKPWIAYLWHLICCSFRRNELWRPEAVKVNYFKINPVQFGQLELLITAAAGEGSHIQYNKTILHYYLFLDNKSSYKNTFRRVSDFLKYYGIQPQRTVTAEDHK